MDAAIRPNARFLVSSVSDGGRQSRIYGRPKTAIPLELGHPKPSQGPISTARFVRAETLPC